MVTGRAPFEGETPSDVIASILRAEPPPLTTVTPETPVELERIVEKALAKDREERYQTAKDLLIDLKRLNQRLEVETEFHRTHPPEMDHVAATTRSGSRAAAATIHHLAAPTGEASAVHATSSAEYVVNEIKHHKLAALLSLVVLALIGAGGLAAYRHAGSTDSSIGSIAVLPFDNQSRDSDAEYISDGLTESVINSLAQLPNLRVIARNSVFRYKGKEADPIVAGNELGVRAVLTGRCMRRGDSLTVSAELVDVQDNKQLWGERYERRVADLLTIQREIAKEISANLRLKLTGIDESRVTKHYTENTEAYQLYLQGRYHWGKRTEQDIQKSIEYLNQAIAKDPSFALAYAGLADAYGVLADYSAIPSNETYPKSRVAAMKALEMDDTLAEAHASLASVKEKYDWDFAGAESEYRRAIELNPNYATAHHWYSEFLSEMGRHEEAIAEEKRALQLDPLSPLISASLGHRYYIARNNDQAIGQLRKTIQMDTNFAGANYFLAQAYLEKGMYEEAITEFRNVMTITGKESPEEAMKRAVALKEAYEKSGARGYWQKQLEITKENLTRRYVSPIEVSKIYARLGEKDEAFAWLRKAYDERDQGLAYLKIDPDWDNLRSDPRFADLVRRVGLPQ
jgi:TolB-like protein/Flp pilus assembly protein TadD